MTQEDINKEVLDTEKDNYELILMFIILLALETDKTNKKTISKVEKFYFKSEGKLNGNRKSLKAIEKDIEKYILALNSLEKSKIESLFVKIAKNNNHNSIKMFGNNKVDLENLISKFSKTSWASDGLTYSKRIDISTAKLSNNIKNEIKRSLISETGLSNLKEKINKHFKSYKKEMERLYHTESVALVYTLNKEIYKCLGFEEFIYMAIIDDRTSEICRNMNNKIFYMSDWKVGLTVPPLHPNCRSSVAPYESKVK